MRALRGDQEPLALEVGFLAVENGVVVIAEGERQASAEPIALTSEEVASLTEKGDYFRRGHIQDEATARQVGRFLFGRVFRDDVHKLFLESRAIARERGVPLRIVLVFPPTSIIQEVPWELLHDGVDFLARHPWTSIVRRMRLRQPSPDLAVEPPLRILFTACEPAGGAHLGLRLEQEARTLRSAMAGSGGRLHVDIAVGNPQNRPLTLQRLEGLFRRARARDRPYHVWHHAGHGGLRRGAEGSEFCLLLESEKGEGTPTPARRISRSIADAGDLKLAVLNLCFSSSTVGLSTELARLNVPAVIGFCGAVVDPAAVELTRVLYQGIAARPLDVVLTEARYAMADCKWPLEWTLPVLFSRSRGRLALLEEAPTRAEATMEGRPLSTRIDMKSQGIRAKRLVQLGTLGASEPGRELEVSFNSSAVEADEVVQIGRLPGKTSEDFRERYLELRETLARFPIGSEEES